jgi:hypothetical protein
MPEQEKQPASTLPSTERPDPSLRPQFGQAAPPVIVPGEDHVAITGLRGLAMAIADETIPLAAFSCGG